MSSEWFLKRYSAPITLIVILSGKYIISLIFIDCFRNLPFFTVLNFTLWMGRENILNYNISGFLSLSYTNNGRKDSISSPPFLRNTLYPHEGTKSHRLHHNLPKLPEEVVEAGNSTIVRKDPNDSRVDAIVKIFDKFSYASEIWEHPVKRKLCKEIRNLKVLVTFKSIQYVSS